MAVILKNLMQRLGFPKYYIQGGDWGGNIAQIMSTLFEDKILGMHSNFCLVNTKYAYYKLSWGAYFPSFTLTQEDDSTKIYPLMEKMTELLAELGYMHIQATYPDTLGKYFNLLLMYLKENHRFHMDLERNSKLSISIRSAKFYRG